MKASSKITEREVAAELAAELNRHIQHGGTAFEKVSVENLVGSLYPDITVWINYASGQAFAFWELKRPGLQEDLSRLASKAQMLGVRYAVVWNFQTGELYEVDDQGKLHPQKPYPRSVLKSLDEWAIPPKKIAALQQAKIILEDLDHLAKGHGLSPYLPDKFYFIGILEKAIHSLVPVLKEQLLQKKKDRKVRSQIDKWTVEQGYPIGLSDLDDLLAHHWAYSLAVRILFYFTVRRYYSGLPDLRPDPGSHRTMSDLLQEAFSKAQTVDWQAVFEPSPLDQLGLPPEADSILDDLLDDFHRYDFGQLKEDVIGQIMEGLLPEEERHALGQYFTREDLVDLIIGFVARREDAYYLDPTCGSGTFLNRLYSRLRWLSGYQTTHGQLLERLWGVDIAHFPAELATINLFRQNVRDLTNFPRILIRDFFQIHPGETFFFPPLKAPIPDYSKVQIPMPMFHGIVGNFPYIRQELIERQNKGYKQEIVSAIARQWYYKDQDLFLHRGIPKRIRNHTTHTLSEGDIEELKKQVRQGHIDLRLSGQADIYAYLFFHAAAFLEEGGRLGIVTSNSWLDVAYGVELKRCFLGHFKIIAIVASWCEPWFEDAAVNTAFVILERCEAPQERARNVIRFVKVKKPLSELLPRNFILREAERWQKVDACLREIETADVRIASRDPDTGQVQALRGVHTLETDTFRIRLIPQAELEAELKGKGETAKWGLYIRTPSVYFDILEHAGDQLVPLSQVAKVRRGYTTGINEFFYFEIKGPGSRPGTLRVQNTRGWIGEIEKDCLRPVIKSPKEAKGLVVDPQTLRYRLFLPPIALTAEAPEKILQANYPLAYEYVQWGAKQETPQGRPWPEVPSVRGRKAWWLLPERKPGRILMPMMNDQRFAIFQNSEAYVDHNLFEFLIAEKDGDLAAALMNSTLFALLRETVSRVNLGDGATKTEGIDWKNNIPIVLPNTLTEQSRARILKAYHKLRQRCVKRIAEEVKQKDRRALDKAVLEALGLDPKVYLPQIYQGLVEMVEERLALPKLRINMKKREQRQSMEQIQEQIRQELLASGIRSIVAFLPTRPFAMEDVPVTGRPHSWQQFFTDWELLDAEGHPVGKVSGTEQQVRYAIYAARSGEYLIQVPANKTVAGKVVQEYEHYLRQVGRELFHRTLTSTRHHRQAEQIVRNLLESLGLPMLAVSVAMEG